MKYCRSNFVLAHAITPIIQWSTLITRGGETNFFSSCNVIKLHEFNYSGDAPEVSSAVASIPFTDFWLPASKSIAGERYLTFFSFKNGERKWEKKKICIE